MVRRVRNKGKRPREPYSTTPLLARVSLVRDQGHQRVECNIVESAERRVVFLRQRNQLLVCVGEGVAPK